MSATTPAIEFVSASAGSGKTWRIVSAAVAAISDGTLRPDALVATTFSVRAATSLRDALQRRLREAHRDDDALTLAGARIGTVHALCASLLRTFAYTLGRPTGLRVAAPDESDALLHDALNQTISADELTRAEALRSSLGAFDALRDAAEVLTLARSQRLDADALLATAPSSVTSLAQVLGEPGAAGTLDDALDRALTSAPGDLALPLLREAQRRRAGGAPLPWSTWLRLSTLDGGAAHDDGLRPTRRAAAAHLRHPRLHAELREAVELVTGLAARSLAPFEGLRRRAGVVDYLDLESLALDLLRRDDVREALRGAFGLVVVDEFQDSSPLQLALFMELASLAPRSLWVGDLKQSIYGFRGADPELVARVVDAVTAGRAPETLSRSWRSRAPLVELTSGLFMPPFVDAGMPEDHVRLVAAHPDDPGLGHALERWRVPDSVALQPVALARGVRQLLDDPSTRVRDPRDGALRRPEARDVAVLARTHARCAAIAHALAALGIPCDYARAGLLSTPEVVLALAAMRLLSDPDDRHAQAEVARLSADAPDDDAWLLAALDDGGALAALPAVAALRSAAHEALLPVAAFDLATLGHGVRAHVARWGDGAQRSANLDALRALAVRWSDLRHAHRRPASMPGFMAWLQRLDRAGDDLCGRVAGSAVSVLTWHASKGLEWPIVVLADVDDGIDDAAVMGAQVRSTEGALDLGDVMAGLSLRYWPSPYARGEEGALAALALRADGPSRQMHAAATRESLRLLYVAWTRARDRLCLAAPSGALTAGVVGLLRKQGVPLTPEPRLGAAMWLRRAWPVVERGLSGRALANAPDGDTSVSVPALAERVAGPHPALWARPSDFVEAGAVVRVERIGAAYAPRGAFDPRSLGSMLHALFAGALFGAPVGAARADEFFTAWGVSGALDRDDALAMLGALRGWISRTHPGATVLPEHPVLRERPDGSTLRGSVDLALVTDESVTVVDHKSHRGADAAARSAEHQGQLRAYGEALSAALERPLAGCWIHLPLAGLMVQICGADEGRDRGEGDAMSTEYHAKYQAHCLQLERAQDDVAGLSRSIANARVDLNPHQIEAALFALRSPLSKGVLLADEVGLGKTIEAGIVLAQKWAEKRRRILLITPATLRKQWQNELASKFFIPSLIVETKTVNDAKKKKERDPFRRDDAVVIVSYEFAYARAAEIEALRWDLVVCDEAHRLRSVYKGTKKASVIAKAIKEPKKVLLTATPLQNNLLELYGLVSVLDDQVFGPQDSFTAQYVKSDDEAERNGALRDRIKTVCHRTLRRQVLEYIRFTKRHPLTLHFVPSEAEQKLYDKVSEYLQRDVLVALPARQRKLITMVLRKLLASSSRAIGATLTKFVDRLKTLREGVGADAVSTDLAEDYEALPETAEEWDDEEASPTTQSAFGKGDATVPGELEELRGYITLAASISEDQKTASLHTGLAQAFTKAAELGAKRKAVIFTESVKTQEYLVEWLSAHGYQNKIVVMNGTNADETSKRIYDAWKKRNASRWKDVSSGSRAADMKAAIVEAFQGDEVELLVATESAAEGVNLQFCSIVVNYDLPWNPQRVEQRIGRCHRYGQQHDVTVVNFVNQKNEADQRVHQLLDQKFRLFEGVFGASDDILGTIESGIDVEQAIADLYQRCRSREEITRGFDELQKRVEDQIIAAMADTRQKVLDHLDEEVHEKLKVHRDRAKETLAERERWLLDLCRYELGARATFDAQGPSFVVTMDDGTTRRFSLRWPAAEERGEEFLRSDHEFAQGLISAALARPTPPVAMTLAYASHASPLAAYRGRSGWLVVEALTLEALERRESSLLLAAVTDDGEVLASDVAPRLLTLGVTSRAAVTGDAPASLAAETDRLRLAQRELSAARERQYLNEEELKLDTRIEDIRLGLEAEIKVLDRDVTALRKASKAAKTLAEKVDAQKKIRAVEDRRDERQRKLYEELKRYRSEHDAYIKTLESQANARAESRHAVFTLRWTVA